MSRSGKVISLVKVTLTPGKDGEEQDKEILTLDGEEDKFAQKPLEMWAKELLLKEQSEEYDSEEAPMMKQLNVDEKLKEVEINDKSTEVEEGDTGKVDEKLSKDKSLKCEESKNVPKPKRERKKSKSKGGDGDVADQVSADVAKEDIDAPIVTSTGDVNNAVKGEDGKSAAVKGPNVVDGSEKSLVKTETESGSC